VAAVRRYQSARIREFLAAYTHAPSSAIEITTSATGDNAERLNVVLSPSALESAPVVTEMLAVSLDLSAAECRDAPQRLLMVRYLQRDNSSRDDFSHFVRMPRVESSTTSALVFIPVHLFANNPFIRLAGLEIPRQQRACITRVARLTTAQQMPLLLESVVTEPAPTMPLYQRLSDDTESLPPHVRAAVMRLWK
jgi:hypothetical protein